MTMPIAALRRRAAGLGFAITPTARNCMNALAVVCFSGDDDCASGKCCSAFALSSQGKSSASISSEATTRSVEVRSWPRVTAKANRIPHSVEPSGLPEQKISPANGRGLLAGQVFQFVSVHRLGHQVAGALLRALPVEAACAACSRIRRFFYSSFLSRCFTGHAGRRVALSSVQSHGRATRCSDRA